MNISSILKKRNEIETELSPWKVTGNLMFLIDLISQNAHSFKTFSNLLEALQYEIALR